MPDPRTIVAPYPPHWPKRYNGNSEPCDMIAGPCCCSAWHKLEEEWVAAYIEQYGLVPTDQPKAKGSTNSGHRFTGFLDEEFEI